MRLDVVQYFVAGSIALRCQEQQGPTTVNSHTVNIKVQKNMALPNGERLIQDTAGFMAADQDLRKKPRCPSKAGHQRWVVLVRKTKMLRRFVKNPKIG
jgi:hypothetical protein